VIKESGYERAHRADTRERITRAIRKQERRANTSKGAHNTFVPGAVAGREVSALSHELGDHAVELGALKH
jgi:hypothetical protein